MNQPNGLSDRAHSPAVNCCQVKHTWMMAALVCDADELTREPVVTGNQDPAGCEYVWNLLIVIRCEKASLVSGLHVDLVRPKQTHYSPAAESASR